MHIHKNMHIYTYILYIQTHIYIYICIHTHTHTHIYIYIYINTSIIDYKKVNIFRVGPFSNNQNWYYKDSHGAPIKINLS